MEEMPVVARQLNRIVVWLILSHANDAFNRIISFLWLVFRPHDVFEDVLACGHPVAVRSPGASVLPIQHRSKANDQRRVRAALDDCHVSENDQGKYYPLDGTRALTLRRALTTATKVQYVSVE